MFHLPEDSVRRRLLIGLGRAGLVILAIGLLLVASTFPVRIGNLSEVRPAFLLIAVYYLTVVRPQTLGPLGVFFAGLALDLLSGYPLGINALLLTGLRALVMTQRRFLMGQSFAVLWAGMGVVALIFAVTEWLLFSVFNVALAPLLTPAVAAFVTVAAFPIVVLPLAALVRGLEAAGASDVA